MYFFCVHISLIVRIFFSHFYHYFIVSSPFFLYLRTILEATEMVFITRVIVVLILSFQFQ